MSKEKPLPNIAVVTSLYSNAIHISGKKKFRNPPLMEKKTFAEHKGRGISIYTNKYKGVYDYGCCCMVCISSRLY